jgi:hypothetical protein
MAEATRDSIVEAAKSAAAQVGPSMSRADFERATGISQYYVYRLFPEGGWSEVKRVAGLDRHAMPTYDIAISFAGEDRPIAKEPAGNLLTEGVNVFYGEYAQAELWGKASMRICRRSPERKPSFA